MATQTDAKLPVLSDMKPNTSGPIRDASWNMTLVKPVAVAEKAAPE